MENNDVFFWQVSLRCQLEVEELFLVAISSRSSNSAARELSNSAWSHQCLPLFSQSASSCLAQTLILLALLLLTNQQTLLKVKQSSVMESMKDTHCQLSNTTWIVNAINSAHAARIITNRWENKIQWKCFQASEESNSRIKVYEKNDFNDSNSCCCRKKFDCFFVFSRYAALTGFCTFHHALLVVELRKVSTDQKFTKTVIASLTISCWITVSATSTSTRIPCSGITMQSTRCARRNVHIWECLSCCVSS